MEGYSNNFQVCPSVLEISKFGRMNLTVASFLPTVDDKGQTLLGIFGLPPYAHVDEVNEAAKAVIKFMTDVKQRNIGGIVVGMSYGPILFSEIGATFRKEAGLLGLS
jgi:hypothetical protein